MKKNSDSTLFEMNQLIQQYMKDKLDRISQDDQSRKNNSFVYFENDTIQLLILYMFMKMEKNDRNTGNENIEDVAQLLDTSKETNHQLFEEVLELLKNRTKGSSPDE